MTDRDIAEATAEVLDHTPEVDEHEIEEILEDAAPVSDGTVIFEPEPGE